MNRTKPLYRNIDAYVRNRMPQIAVVGGLLTVFGFVYQVIGAWPDWSISMYIWGWQADIASLGSVVVWLLFFVSLFALIIGVVLLYFCSKIYNEQHPDDALAKTQ